MQLVPAIVPVQALRRGWAVDPEYRLTVYPLTACPLVSVVAAQLTVTARPATVAVGVAPWLTAATADAPLLPAPEPAVQYPHARPLVIVNARVIAARRLSVVPPGTGDLARTRRPFGRVMVRPPG